jgi:hypothetical protein
MRRPVGTPDPAAFVGACTLAGASPTPRNPSARHQRRNSDALRTPGDRSSAAFRSASGIRARRCDRGHSSRLVSDRLPVDPDNRLALPAPSHCCFRLGRAYRSDPQPARCGDRSRVLRIDPRRLSPFSLDRFVQLQRDAHNGREVDCEPAQHLERGISLDEYAPGSGFSRRRLRRPRSLP